MRVPSAVDDERSDTFGGCPSVRTDLPSALESSLLTMW
jgi:hypothetical protein